MYVNGEKIALSFVYLLQLTHDRYLPRSRSNIRLGLLLNIDSCKRHKKRVFNRFHTKTIRHTGRTGPLGARNPPKISYVYI